MLTNEAFARLVAEDVKNRVTDEQKRYLRMPENLERWQRNLVALLGNLAQQLDDLADRERDETDRFRALGDDGTRLLAEAQADITERRKRISRFRFHVETRLDEATRLIAVGESDPGAELSVFMRRAIEKHREMLTGADLDPTPIDKALWATLAGHWLFDEIDLSEV